MDKDANVARGVNVKFVIFCDDGVTYTCQTEAHDHYISTSQVET